MSLVKNRVVLITNCLTPFGKSISEYLGKRGAKLVLTDPNSCGLQVQLTDLKSRGFTVEPVRYDGSTELEKRKAFVQSAADSFSGIDCFVSLSPPNKATGNVMKTSENAFDELMQEQFTARFRLCQEVVPFLEKSRNGSIIMTTSIAGFTPFGDIGLYSIAQSGLLGMCKALAISAAKRNVRVNTICTGMVNEDGSGAFWDNDTEFLGTGMQEMSGMVPIGRFGRPGDINALVELLLSDRATYITGENIIVSGGVNVRF